jgi:hypothetical protein
MIPAKNATMPAKIRKFLLYRFSKNCASVRHLVDLNRYITQPDMVIARMIIPWLRPHQDRENPATKPISKNITIDIAPSPATPLETEITYLPAVRPAERKSVTLFIRPLVMLTE